MTLNTHCLPSGSLAANEIPVCNVSVANTSVAMPTGGLGNGNIRGVVVAMHGLSVAYQPIPPVSSIGNSTIAGYSSSGADFEANLNNDGWIVLSVPYPEDFNAIIGASAIWNDINSDTSNGSRYLRNQMHWWDHVVEFVQSEYGENIPIVPYGGSWGGYHTLAVAINRQSSIIAYCSLVPATIISNASPVYTSPANYGPNQVVSGYTFSTPLTNGTAGLDLAANALNPNIASPIGITNTNGVTVPGIILYGLNDGAVGWETTASLPGVLPINSNIDKILTNAYNAGLPVIRNQTNNIHEMTNDDAGYSATYINGTTKSLATINSSGRLDIQNTGGLYPFNSALLSGICSIYASDNQWHNISCTNFGFLNYCSTAVSDVTSNLPSTLTLGDTSQLNKSSGVVSIVTSGTSLLASYSSISGNTLKGITYISGTGSITGDGTSQVNLVNYVMTPYTNVTTLSNATLTLSSTVGLDPGGGKVYIATTAGVYFPLQASYSGVSGNTITGVTYIGGGGNIAGTTASTISLITPLTGVSISNPGSASVSSGAPVRTHGIPITGGFMNMSFIYWFTQYVDPIAPRMY